MDTVDNELLYRDLERYGYNLVSPMQSDPAAAVARVLNSNDGRVLEGVPVMLSNMLMQGESLDLMHCEHSLPKGLQKRFRILVAITYYFLLWVPQSESNRKLLLKYLRKSEPGLLEQVQTKLSERGTFQVGNGVTLDSNRLENTYRNYVVHELMTNQENLSKRLDDERQAAFLHALNLLFTDRQRELIFKLLNKKELTKTEREYYSRTVKPRLKALRNTDLMSLAATLTGI